MNKNIKYLIEEIQNFNPVEYDADEYDIIDQHAINDITVIKPKNRDELEKIIIQRLKINPKEPYLLDIDVSNINDFFCLFADEDPKGYDTYLVEAGIKVNKIKKLDLSAWTNTSNVDDMCYMFAGCEDLIKIVIPFNTSNVRNMSGLFSGCSSLKTIDLSSFDTSNVEDMSYMFRQCESLRSLDLSNFDTSSVYDMSYMFQFCESLKVLDLSSFNTANVNNMSGMFNYCKSIETFDLSNFDITNIQNMSYMFDGCESIESLDLSYFHIPQNIDISFMFKQCKSLKYLDISNIEAIQYKGMFNFCESLETLKLSKSAIRHAFFINSVNFKNIEMK